MCGPLFPVLESIDYFLSLYYIVGFFVLVDIADLRGCTFIPLVYC